MCAGASGGGGGGAGAEGEGGGGGATGGTAGQEKRKKPRRKPSRKSGRSSGRPARQETLRTISHIQLSELPILISVSASLRLTTTSQTTKPTASGWWRRWRNSATAWSWPGTAGKYDDVLLLSWFSETQLYVGEIVSLFGLICSLQTLNEALASGNKEQSKAALEKQVRNTLFTLFALSYKSVCTQTFGDCMIKCF